MTFDQNKLWDCLQPLLKQFQTEIPVKITVGFSGGLDSTVLLYALHQLSSQTENFQLSAVHINHQIQKESDSWESFCRNFCLQHKIPFQAECIQVEKTGKGVEAAARDARYAALSKLLDCEDLLFTAHHLDDHIETIFLKLIRGTGVDGVKGIQAVSKVNGLHVIRPLLNFDRESLEQFAKAEKLTWIEDPSNKSEQFDRNYLRLNVLPLIEQRWPAYKKTIHRFSENIVEANLVIQDSIEKKFNKLFDKQNNSLCVSELSKLPLEQQMLILRFWIKEIGFSTPSKKQLQQIQNIIRSRNDAHSLVEWDGAQVRRFKDSLYIFKKEAVFITQQIHWDLENFLVVPGVGVLEAKETLGRGIKKSYLQQGVSLKFRVGGEVCRPTKRLHTHSLKKLFQEYEVPPWQRDKIPLICIQNEIVQVVDYFYCDPFEAKEDELGVEITLKNTDD